MKQLFTLLLCVGGLTASAQSLKLTAGQKLTMKTNSDMQMDMGMGEMSMKMESQHNLEVKSVSGSAINADLTATKIKMNVDAMGQNMDYDSESKTNNAEMEEAVGASLNRAMSVTIDGSTGVASDVAASKDGAEEFNPMSGMGGDKSPASLASGIFLVIPAGKKAGDTWSSELSKDGMKSVNSYTLKSVNGDIATVSVISKFSGTTKKEINGSEIEMTMSGTNDSEIDTNTATGIVNKNVTKTKMEMSMDMMGQAMNFTTTGTTTTKVD